MASLDVYMNEYYVGIFTKKAQGRIYFNIHLFSFYLLYSYY